MEAEITNEIQAAREASLYAQHHAALSSARAGVNEFRTALGAIEASFRERIVGQDEMLHKLLLALVLDEHVLLEGLPGVGKTEIVKWVAHVTGLPFQRVQFIPDMLPSDLIGKDKIEPAKLQLLTSPDKDERLEGAKDAVKWHNGPLFCSLVLADEINRAPSKVQAALLEAMGENQITPFGQAARPVYSAIHEAAYQVWAETDRGKRGEGMLGLPAIPHRQRRDLAQFTVFATMNPIEQEGTYPLSEAQLDRFCFKVLVPYPSRAGRDNYWDITRVVYKPDAPPPVVESQHAVEHYVAYFLNHKPELEPVLFPVYFFLKCRSLILPTKIGDRELHPAVETVYGKAMAERQQMMKIMDLVYATNIQGMSSSRVRTAKPLYAQPEQMDIMAYINEMLLGTPEERARGEALNTVRHSPHCKYVKAGASPRGFLKLAKAALAEAFLDPTNDGRVLADRHIWRNAYDVLRHRVHMDVQARIEQRDSTDVIRVACESVLKL
jgi:MoxR-like ATPase